MKPVQKLIKTALKQEKADITIYGANIFNVFTGTFEKKDIAVADGFIAALAFSHDNGQPVFEAKETVNGAGQWLVPGFIDAHVHIESGMVSPEEFTAMLAAHGTTTIVADPHEIGNVFGMKGIEYILAATEQAPIQVFCMLPSCVPASALEKANVTLLAEDLKALYKHPRVLGLGELMNFPGVLSADKDVMDKINSVLEYNEQNCGNQQGLFIDGHAPFLQGFDLAAYIAAGIQTDHEASTVEEAVERLSQGMALIMREGSSVHNVLDLVPAVTEHTAFLCLLCTDDRHPEDVIKHGNINHLVRLLVKDGRLPLATILKMASYNAARFYSMAHTGAIAPGYKADFALYADLENWFPAKVWSRGTLVAEAGKAIKPVVSQKAEFLHNSVKLQAIKAENLKISAVSTQVKCIETIPHQLVTNNINVNLKDSNGYLEADVAQDVAKLAVWERHQKTGRIGLGFVKGLGLKQGALASTVAHDSHNLVVVGMNDEDMLLAVKTLQDVGGGLVVCNEGRVLSCLPLPLAGLLSDKSIFEVQKNLQTIHTAVRGLGLAEGYDPFMNLAFLTLAVIPTLKLTDCGLVDITKFDFVPLYN